MAGATMIPPDPSPPPVSEPTLESGLAPESIGGPRDGSHLFVDATAAGHRLTGLERYAREVTSALWTIAREKSLRLTVLTGRMDTWADSLEPFPGGMILRSPVKIRLLTDHLWVPFQVYRLRPSHAFFPAFAPSPFIFMSKAHTMRTIHDTVLWEYPETISWKARLYFRPLENFGLSRYRTIFTVSQRARRDLSRLFPSLVGQIMNAGNGLNASWDQPPDGEDLEKNRQRFHLSGPFLLFVGTLEPRKNLPFLVRVFARVLPSFPGLKLVLVGRKGWGSPEVLAAIQGENVADHVIWLQDVDDESLRSLYRMASLFVYPSLNEGFGLPLVEAMACGLPIVASPEAASPEIVGQAAVLCPTGDIEAWNKAVTDLLKNSEERARLSAEGLSQSQSFRWSFVAENILGKVLEIQ